jgi:hypothetical protein
MKNPFHRLKHLLEKTVRRNCHLPVINTSHDETLKRAELYNETWGELQAKPTSELRKVFRSYIYYMKNHPSSSSFKHSRRTSPGSVIAEQPHPKAHSSHKQMAEQNQYKLEESNRKLAKKLIKTSKVRWKKIS